MEILRFVVYSDYLCPWCWNASIRLRSLEVEYAGRVVFEWRSYLLRPNPGRRDLEKFRAYTRSWQRPAAEPGGGEFREWQGNAGPPSHSVPPHLVAKAAARLGDDSFRRMHERLMSAYFFESRDTTDRDTLIALWREIELPADAFEVADDPALLEQVLDEHNEALSMGVNGVPAVRLADVETAIVGAQPIEIYRRWIDRSLARRGEALESS